MQTPTNTNLALQQLHPDTPNRFTLVALLVGAVARKTNPTQNSAVLWAQQQCNKPALRTDLGGGNPKNNHLLPKSFKEDVRLEIDAHEEFTWIEMLAQAHTKPNQYP